MSRAITPPASPVSPRNNVQKFLRLREKFCQWLRKNGADVLPEREKENELIRFRTKQGLGIIYHNNAGNVSHYIMGAYEAFDCFLRKEPWEAIHHHELFYQSLDRRKMLVKILARRDGLECIYCGKRLTLQNATVEHLLSLADGGSDTQANTALACRECNSTLLNAPVVEKIKFALKQHANSHQE